MALVQEYLDYQDLYEKKYGEKTIVFMEVGSFIEIYGIETDSIKKGRVSELHNILNFTVTGKQVSLDKYGVVNRLMIGFPNSTIDKWTDILVKHGYTIIVILQDSHGKKGPSRTVTEIISPGINIDTQHFSNYLMSIYLEEIKDHKTGKPHITLGLSIVDISTGETIVYETHSTPDDYRYAFDEIFRFIQSHCPSEIILHCNNISWSKEEIIRYLEIGHITVHYDFYKDKPELLKQSIREEILNRVYSEMGTISPIEYIGLEKSYSALIAYIYLIQFTYEHNETIVEKLTKPVLWDSNKYLVLSHDSIMQLNVISDKNSMGMSGISSLWDILDKTVTCLGKRYLKYKLLHPILDSTTLEHTYNIVELLQRNYLEEPLSIYKNIHSILQPICDIERLHRKMAVHLIHPQDFNSLDMGYCCIQKLLTYINQLDIPELQNEFVREMPSSSIQTEFNEYMTDYRSKIKLNEIMGVYKSNITNNFFIEGVYPEIDDIQKRIDYHTEYFNALARALSYCIDSTGKIKVEIKETDKEGHYLSTTISRGKQLQKLLTKKTEIALCVNNDKIIIQKSDLEFKKTTASFKIFSPGIKQNSHLWRGYQDTVKKVCISKLKDLCALYYTKYSTTLQSLCSFISWIDYACCIANVSISNGYTRPSIDTETDYSYIDAIDIRHPIIEKIKDQTKYIPNNVQLGLPNQGGILLYGVNAVGKSSYMKSIGLAIIMAQAGYYVPATSFRFALYKYLFTRISSNDNIFKGQSTFAVELSELRSIFKRTNNNSLVLGDELCSGTETVSGLSIVTAGVLQLSNANSSFVFATHLHQLSKMDEIRECNNVKNYHMETIYDEKTQILTYNRKLKEGSGNSIYGLEVAKAMDLDPEFIECANKIRKRLMNIPDDFVVPKTSGYNAQVIISKCSICNDDATATHHIEEQHLADSNGMINHFHKNKKFNLVPLCDDCHHDVHHGKLIIHGFVDTTGGKKLSYNYSDHNGDVSGETRKKKYSKDQIDIIKDIYSKTKQINATKNTALVQYNINIASATIKKIITDKY
jgi:DNA mismatch repair protein MutS